MVYLDGFNSKESVANLTCGIYIFERVLHVSEA